MLGFPDRESHSLSQFPFFLPPLRSLFLPFYEVLHSALSPKPSSHPPFSLLHIPESIPVPARPEPDRPISSVPSWPVFQIAATALSYTPHQSNPFFPDPHGSSHNQRRTYPSRFRYNHGTHMEDSAGAAPPSSAAAQSAAHTHPPAG